MRLPVSLTKQPVLYSPLVTRAVGDQRDLYRQITQDLGRAVTAQDHKGGTQAIRLNHKTPDTHWERWWGKKWQDIGVSDATALGIIDKVRHERLPDLMGGVPSDPITLAGGEHYHLTSKEWRSLRASGMGEIPNWLTANYPMSAGSIVYIDANQYLAGDSAHLAWDYSNNYLLLKAGARVGIGTATPDGLSEIAAAAAQLRSYLTVYSDTKSHRANLEFRKANNTLADPDGTRNNDWLGGVNFRGYEDETPGWTDVIARIRALAAEETTDAAQGTALYFEVVPTGGSTTLETVLQIENGQNLAADGSSSAPSWGFQSDATLGGYYISAGRQGLAGELQLVSGGLFGATGKRLAAETKYLPFTIKSPVAADDFPVAQFPRAVTITAIRAICLGGTNVVGVLTEYGTDGTTAGADVDSTDWTITTSEFNDTGAFANAGIAAGGYIRWKTVSVSGSVNFLHVTVEYMET